MSKATIHCSNCNRIHTATFSHTSAIDGKQIFRATCTKDGLDDCYTEDHVSSR